MQLFVLAFLALTLGANLPTAAQGPAPSAARVAEVVRELQEVLKSAGEERQVAVLQRTRDVPHPDVIKVVAQALEHDSRTVRSAAMSGLRWMEHPEAVAPLLSTFEDNKKIGRDEAEQVNLLKAIGQHGDRRSIKLLTKTAFRSKNRDLSKVCLLGLGMIREDATLDAFIKLLKSTDPKIVARNADSMRLGLMMLTGVDHGRDSERWLAWWKQAKKDFEMSPVPPSLPIELTRRWNSFWSIRDRDPRPERREDRGGAWLRAPASR